MAKPDDNDYVNLPGVTPITPASFAPGSPPNPAGQTINLPEQVIGPDQDNRLAQWQAMDKARSANAAANAINLPEQQINAPLVPGKAPAAPPANPNAINLAPVEVSPMAPSEGFFSAKPLSPQQGVQEDAKVFADLADYYRKSGDALSQGKFEEAQAHHDFARQQEQSIAQSNTMWQQAVADQNAREERMNHAIAKGKALSIDPDNYWNRKGTASNILAAISVGLGAFGSGMTKGATGNPALTLVNNAIEHDIQSQKDNIENYWKTVQQQMHLDDNAFNRSLVTQNMQANMRLAGYKVYESDLKTIQAKSDSQMVKLGAQKQIDDLQLAMNNERKQLAATIAAQQAAAAAQTNKDSESFNKDMMEYMKEHPGMNPQDAAKDIAAINPARAARLGSRSALPTAAQEDFIYSKEKGYAGAFNSALNEVSQHSIAEFEKRAGHKATDADKDAIKQQTAMMLIKQHPEFGKFQYFKPTINGLQDVRPAQPTAVSGEGGADRRSKEQIERDKEREVYVDQPILGPNNQPVIGANGQPQMRKVLQLAVNKKAAEDYVKWSNMEPVIKQQLTDLKSAWAEGNVAKYNALRGAIIEKLPAIYGFERGPSSAQVEHTFKDLIPEYEHWYAPSTDARWNRDKAVTDKLAVAENELNLISNGVRTNAFGPQAGGGRTVGSFNPSAGAAPVSATPAPIINFTPDASPGKRQ